MICVRVYYEDVCFRFSQYLRQIAVDVIGISRTIDFFTLSRILLF